MKVKRFKDDVYSTVPEGSSSSNSNVPAVKSPPASSDVSDVDVASPAPVVSPTIDMDASMSDASAGTEAGRRGSEAGYLAAKNASSLTGVDISNSPAASSHIAANAADDSITNSSPSVPTAGTTVASPTAATAVANPTASSPTDASPTDASGSPTNYTLQNLASMTETKEQKEKRIRKEKARAVVGGIGDALTVFSNIFSASKGAAGTGVKANLLNRQSAIMDKEGSERKVNKEKLASIKDRLALQENNRKIAARAAAIAQANKDRDFNYKTKDGDRNFKLNNDKLEEEKRNNKIVNDLTSQRLVNDANRIAELGEYHRKLIKNAKEKAENEAKERQWEATQKEAASNGEILLKGSKGAFTIRNNQLSKIKFGLIDALRKDPVWMNTVTSMTHKTYDPASRGYVTVTKRMTNKELLDDVISDPDPKYQNLISVLSSASFQSESAQDFLESQRSNKYKNTEAEDRAFIENANKDTIDGYLKVKK